MNGPSASGGQPFPGPIGGEGAVAQAFDATRRPNPEAPLTVLEERRDGGARAIAFVEHRHAKGIETQKPPRSTNPEIRPAIHAHRQSRNVSQARGDPFRREFRPVPAHDAPVCAHPHIPVPDGKDHVDLPVRQSFRYRTDAPPGQVEEALSLGPHPDRAVLRLPHGSDRGAHGQESPGGDGLEPIPGPAQRAIHYSRHHDRAIPSARHRGDGILRRLERTHGLELAVAIPNDLGSAEPHPQVALGVCGESQDLGDEWCRPARIGKRSERLSVEAQEAPVRADPEVAVDGLADSLYRPAGESLLRPPAIAHVLRHRAVRVHCLRGPRQSHQSKHGDKAPPASHGRYSNFSMTTSVPRARGFSLRRNG